MTPAISLAQVTELQSGSYIDEPFIVEVMAITPKTGKAPGNKKFWVIKMNDTSGSAAAEMSMFTAPKFSEGDHIEISGQGNKFEQNQYGNKISLGKSPLIVVVNGAPPPSPTPRAPGSSNPTPPAHDPHPSHQLPEEVAAIKHAKFHLKMKKLSLLRLQCFDYAQQVIGKACNAGFIAFRDGDESTRAEMVGTVSAGLFIETCRRGLDDTVAPLGPPPKPQQPPAAPLPVQPPPQRAAQPPPSNQPPARTVEEHSRNTQAFDHRGSHVDEDVPF